MALFFMTVALFSLGICFIYKAIKIIKKQDSYYFFGNREKEYWIYIVSSTGLIVLSILVYFIEFPQKNITRNELILTGNIIIYTFASFLFFLVLYGTKKGRETWKKVSREMDKAMK